MCQSASYQDDPNLLENRIDRFLDGWTKPDLPPADPEDFLMIVDDGGGRQ